MVDFPHCFPSGGQSPEHPGHPVAADTAIMADSELCAVGNIKARLLPTQAVQQETEGHEQSGDQGNKPLIGRQVTKAVTVLVLNTVAPEMLKIPEGREMEQRHDKQHLAKAELAGPVPPAARGDKLMTLPVFKCFGKIIKTTEQSSGRKRHERDPIVCYQIRSMNHINRDLGIPLNTLSTNSYP